MTEYKLSYTAKEIDEKLGKIDEHETKFSELSKEIADHEDDTTIHITSAERTKWNKVTDKVDKSGITLGEHTDGLIYIFVDGVPKGNGVEMGTTGDIVGIVDSENNIVLTGELADGTYTIVYEDADGEQTAIGGFTLGAVLELFVPATCVLNKRLNSSGAETSQNGTFVTDFIDIGDLAVGATRDILFSGFQIQMNRGSAPYTKIDVYDTAKSRIGIATGMQSSDEIVYDASGTKTFKATVTNPSTSKTARYIKITGHLGEDYSIQGTNAITSVDQLANCSLILA